MEAEVLVMDLEREVAKARARLHRSIGQRGRWAMHDFLREIRELREQAELFYGRRALAPLWKAGVWDEGHGAGSSPRGG